MASMKFTERQREAVAKLVEKAALSTVIALLQSGPVDHNTEDGKRFTDEVISTTAKLATDEILKTLKGR